ncbi:MAG: RNA methyltransferase [Candidatus Zixiibacteriota bacterium]|nr:MAG: RNA methyltransferase [candidate division Zixibacteria bacterium]
MSITKAELKQVKALSTAKGRKLSRRFLAEGTRLLEEALRHRFLPDRIYFASALLGRRGEKLMNRLKGHRIACAEVSARELRDMAQTEAPQGILGVFAMPDNELSELRRPRYRRILWCEGIADPGNLGTLVRSAQAFEFDPVVLTENCADAFAPKVVRSSAGAVFGRQIVQLGNKDVLAFARKHRFTIIAAGTRGKKIDYSLIKALEKVKLILAIGSEADGLSEEIVRHANLTVTIPHSRKTESLNAAVAGSILMNEFYCRREEP